MKTEPLRLKHWLTALKNRVRARLVRKTGSGFARGCLRACCASLALSGLCSCALLTGALDEIASDEERYFLRVYSAVVFYNLGDEFVKATDYKVEKVRHDGRVWRIPNAETKCYIEGKLIDSNQTHFYFWGKAIVRVELDDLFDEYVAVVNAGGGDSGGGSGGGGGNTGGGIIIKW